MCVRPLPSFLTRKKCSVSKNKVDLDQKNYRNLVEGVLVEFPKVKLWNPSDYLCHEGECPAMMDGHFLYHEDRHHLTTYASWYLGKSLVDVIFPNNQLMQK